jgi:UV DNA damage endonuclease
MNNNTRLGYACINQTLGNRPKKLGGRITTSRGIKKGSWYNTRDLAKIGELALQNASDLLHILKWNEENDIRLFRIGSDLIPWHDHFETHELPQAEHIKARLLEAGDYARAHGHRLSCHPGPFHILGSPHAAVVDKTITSLERQSELFDLMGFEPSYNNKVNIHIGAAYGNPEATVQVWKRNWHRLSDSCKARLVVENDDKTSMYTVQMLYDFVHTDIGIPITFDYFHHSLNPGHLTEQQALELARSTWPSHIRQACHYSESRRTEYQTMLQGMCDRNNITIEELATWPTLAKYKKEFDKIKITAHADYIKLPINTYGYDLDIMVEAKAKELALLEYRNIYTKEELLS